MAQNSKGSLNPEGFFEAWKDTEVLEFWVLVWFGFLRLYCTLPFATIFDYPLSRNRTISVKLMLHLGISQGRKIESSSRVSPVNTCRS